MKVLFKMHLLHVNKGKPHLNAVEQRYSLCVCLHSLVLVLKISSLMIHCTCTV